jgi:hypothetical protein
VFSVRHLLPGSNEELPTLTPWAAEFRYDDLPEAGLDRQEALSVVQKVKAWADTELVAPDPDDGPEP